MLTRALTITDHLVRIAAFDELLIHLIKLVLIIVAANWILCRVWQRETLAFFLCSVQLHRDFLSDASLRQSLVFL